MTDAAAYCAELVRDHAFPLYASTLFTDATTRRDLLALYALDVEVSRVPAVVRQPIAGEMRLQWWRDALDGNAHGGVAGNPVMAELLRLRSAHDLPADLLARLIDARRFDLYDEPMPSLAALDIYCDDTAGALCDLAARICGHAADADLIGRAGRTIGLADAARRPRRFGLARENIVAAAQSYRSKAVTLLEAQPPAARIAFLPLALTAWTLAHPDDEPSRLRVLWSMWRMQKAAIAAIPPPR